MNLAEKLAEMPSDEMIYFGVEDSAGFITIEPCDELRGRLPQLSKKYRRMVSDCLNENQNQVKQLPDMIKRKQVELESLQKDLDATRGTVDLNNEDEVKALNKLKDLVRRTKNRISFYKQNLRGAETRAAKAEAILQSWTPFESRPVLESYPRFKLCGGGTAVIVPGDLIGVPTGYWFREEVVEGKVVQP